MQLRLSNSLVGSLTAIGFKNSASFLLSGITVIGVFSTVVFSTKIVNDEVDTTIQKISEVFKSSPFYEGIKKIEGALKEWGIKVVTAQDDFKNWIRNYLNPSGFKSGFLELYQKLYDWALIVYTWFKDKFIEFIKNIPEMVKNWKNLRLSLFKWGTFLGGGGGGALWGMFGSWDILGRLSELMGNPQFGEIFEKFSNLLEENPEAFADMTKEEAEELFEKILEDPEEAKENIEELIEEQEEKNKEKEKKQELTKEEILDKFNSSGGGAPKTPQAAFRNMISDALQDLTNNKSSSWDRSDEFVAWNAMNKYINTIKEEVKKKPKKWEAKENFLSAISGNEQAFINSIAKSAKKAVDNLKTKPFKYEDLAKEFAKVLENEFTVESEEGEDGVSIQDHVPLIPRKKK